MLNFIKLIPVFVMMWIFPNVYSQLLSKNNNRGFVLQSRYLPHNSYNNKINFKGDFSCGLFYTFLYSKSVSIPSYLTLCSDYYNYQGRSSYKNYIEAEVAYRWFLPFENESPIYIEGGILGRCLLSSDTIRLNATSNLYFNQFSVIPKLGIGIKVKQCYINLEYWRSLTNVVKYERQSMKQYIGIRVCFIFKEFFGK